MPATLTTIPDDFGSGGKGIAPNSAPKGTATLVELLQEMQVALATGATGKFQSGSATLVAGTVTVATTIVLTANSRILVSHDGRPTGSTDYAGLAVVSRTAGAAGVADFVLEAIVAAGTIDIDAVGDIDWMIID